MKLLPISDRGGSRPQEQHVRGSKRPPGNDALDAPPGRRQGTITHMKPAIVAAPKPAVGGATGGSRVGGVALPSGATGVKGSSGGTGLTVSFDCDEIRSCRTSILSVGAGSTVSAISSSAWEEGSVCTTGTDAGRSSLDTDAPGLSGIPYGDSDEDDDDVFEAADSFDLGAVDLCVSTIKPQLNKPPRDEGPRFEKYFSRVPLSPETVFSLETWNDMRVVRSIVLRFFLHISAGDSEI